LEIKKKKLHLFNFFFVFLIENLMDLVVVVGYKEEISTVEKKSNELDKLFHMNESFVASKYEVVGGDCVRP